MRSYEEIKTLDLEKIVECMRVVLQNPKLNREIHVDKHFIELFDNFRNEIKYRKEKYDSDWIERRDV